MWPLALTSCWEWSQHTTGYGHMTWTCPCPLLPLCPWRTSPSLAFACAVSSDNQRPQWCLLRLAISSSHNSWLSSQMCMGYLPPAQSHMSTRESCQVTEAAVSPEPSAHWTLGLGQSMVLKASMAHHVGEYTTHHGQGNDLILMNTKQKMDVDGVSHHEG